MLYGTGRSGLIARPPLFHFLFGSQPNGWLRGHLEYAAELGFQLVLQLSHDFVAVDVSGPPLGNRSEGGALPCCRYCCCSSRRILARFNFRFAPFRFGQESVTRARGFKLVVMTAGAALDVVAARAREEQLAVVATQRCALLFDPLEAEKT